MNLRWFSPVSSPTAGVTAAAANPPPPDLTLTNPAAAQNSAIDQNENVIDGFEIIEKHSPYCKPLETLHYNKNDPGSGTSSHRVIESHDPVTGEQYFLKFYDNEAMLYAESFLNHLYSLSLLYGVARCHVRLNDSYRPVALSSKKIPNFRTFKDKNCQLTAEKLKDPAFRHRFLKILAIIKRMHEDDGHSGNITIDLKLFDAGCAYWDVNYKICGGRPGVDNMLPVNRDPDKAFDLYPEDIVNFPVIVRAQPWYSPCLDCPVTSYVNNNPFIPEETRLVRELKHDPQALPVFFQEAIDWLLDISVRFPHLARLHFPDNLEVRGENVIGLFCKKDQEITEQYFNILTELTEFKEFLKRNWRTTLIEILVRCEIRNYRLQQDREKNPEWDKLFANTLLEPDKIIANYNQLVSRINDSQILAFSCANRQPGIVKQSILLPHSIFVAGPMDNVDMIHPFIAWELQAEAKTIAQRLISTEQKYGTEDWQPFLQENNLPENKITFRANIRTSND